MSNNLLVWGVSLDEWRLADRDVLDQSSETSHVVLVQQVLVHRNQVQLVKQLKVLRRYPSHVGDCLITNKSFDGILFKVFSLLARKMLQSKVTRLSTEVAL